MAVKKGHFETGGPPLGQEAFGNLREMLKDLPPPEKTHEPKPESPPGNTPRPPYFVRKTRKGNWPISLERRGGGKWVTVLSNVEGDATQLLALLRKHCGAGGVVREGAIEIQGNQSAQVAAFLETVDRRL